MTNPISKPTEDLTSEQHKDTVQTIYPQNADDNTPKTNKRLSKKVTLSLGTKAPVVFSDDTPSQTDSHISDDDAYASGSVDSKDSIPAQEKTSSDTKNSTRADIVKNEQSKTQSKKISAKSYDSSEGKTEYSGDEKNDSKPPEELPIRSKRSKSKTPTRKTSISSQKESSKSIVQTKTADDPPAPNRCIGNDLTTNTRETSHDKKKNSAKKTSSRSKKNSSEPALKDSGACIEKSEQTNPIEKPARKVTETEEANGQKESSETLTRPKRTGKKSECQNSEPAILASADADNRTAKEKKQDDKDEEKFSSSLGKPQKDDASAKTSQEHPIEEIDAEPNCKKTESKYKSSSESKKINFSHGRRVPKDIHSDASCKIVREKDETFPQNNMDFKGKFDIYGKSKDSKPIDRIPAYPPEDKGLPAASAEAIVKTQSELIGEIRRKLALGDTLFEQIIRPSLLSFAGYAHLLPASEHNHHNAAGGLWRHSLETASIALDAMETCAGFAPDMDLPPFRRKQMETAERVISFAAALMHDAGKPASDMLVTADTGQVWDPFTENLDIFLARSGAKRYFVSYLPNRYKRHEYFASVLTGRFAPPVFMSWLSSVSPETVRTLLFAIYPQEGYARSQSKAALIAKTVKDADCMSAARDLKRRLYVADKASLGIRPIEQALGIMRDLVSEGVWKTNAPGARLWHTRDGLFLAWSGGFSDISKKLAECVPNICPALASDWLRLLAGSGIIEENPAAIDGYIFLGKPEGVKSDKIRFVRFTDPCILLKNPLPDPVGIEYSGAKPVGALQAAGSKIAEEILKDAVPTPSGDKDSADTAHAKNSGENNFGRKLGRSFADKLRADNPDIDIPMDFNGKEAKLFVQEVKKIRAEAAKETKAAIKEALKTQKGKNSQTDE